MDTPTAPPRHLNQVVRIFNMPYSEWGLEDALPNLKRIRAMMRATVSSIREHRLDELEGPSGHIEHELFEKADLTKEDIERMNAKDGVVMRIISLENYLYDRGYEKDQVWGFPEKLHEIWGELQQVKNDDRNWCAHNYNVIRKTSIPGSKSDIYRISQPWGDAKVDMFRAPLFRSVMERWEPALEAMEKIIAAMEDALVNDEGWYEGEEGDSGHDYQRPPEWETTEELRAMEEQWRQNAVETEKTPRRMTACTVFSVFAAVILAIFLTLIIKNFFKCMQRQH